MADISKIKTLDGTTYNIKDATARSSIPAAATSNPVMDGTAAVGSSTKYAKEDHRHPSDTTKYTINNYGQGTTDLSIRPLIAYSRANRLAFLPADQIIIENTTDGGTTWVDAGYSDAQKKALFATRGTNIYIPLLNGAKSTQCGVRVTITGMKYNVPAGTPETGKYAYWNSTYINSQERYSNLREMWFWLSANNDSIRVQVYRATGANSNNWISDFNTDFPLTGWSGSDWIRLSGNTFGGGTTQTGNYWNWRIIFWSRMHDGDTAFRSANQQSISGIAGYGDNVWGTPNPLMKEDHLYTWDTDMNVSFPAKVTASGGFVGNITGYVTGDISGTANTATNVSASAGTANADRHVWFSDSASETKRAYDDDLKYNPSTNVLTVGSISGSAASATKATQDESGNNIKASYASSMSISDHTITLKNKNGVSLGTVTVPDNTVEPATEAPLANMDATVGTSLKYAREDHRHPAVKIPPIWCDTLSAEAAKVANGNSGYFYSLREGNLFSCEMYYANTAQSALTFRVGTTGAKSIYINGTASSSTNYTLPAGSYLVYYDGTVYHFRTDGKIPGPITNNATASTAGLMSAADKSKLDVITGVAVTDTEPTSDSILAWIDTDSTDTVTLLTQSEVNAQYVSYDHSQTLTSAQQNRALQNVGVTNGTDAQKTNLATFAGISLTVVGTI